MKCIGASLRAAAVLVAIFLFVGALPVAGERGEVQPAQGSTAFSLPWTPPLDAYRIKVQADGLYALTYPDLATAGLPVDSLDPRSFQLYGMGKEVPIRVLGEDDAHFDSGDTVLFYGRGVDSLFLDGIFSTNKYTGDNVYWLTYSCATSPCAGPYGLRMADVDGSASAPSPLPYLHREHIEKSTWYYSGYPMEQDADHWYADWVSPSIARTYSFYAYNLPVDTAPATLSIDLLGWSTSTHHLRLLVNGTLVIDGSPTWTDYTKYRASVSIPASLLQSGQNRVRVEVGLDPGVPTDTFYVNWVDVTYRDTYVAESGTVSFGEDAAGAWHYAVTKLATASAGVYEVTDWLAPRRVTQTTITGSGPYTVSFSSNLGTLSKYLVAESSAWRKPVAIEHVTRPASAYIVANLLDASNHADYILIAHSDFWQQAIALASYRSLEMRVVLVDVQQIYDQFNGGLMSAEAIRDFLAYARGHWTTPAPAYVLLFGDGNYDMRQYRTIAKTYIPPFLSLADPDMGETAAENRFVAFDGADNLPDLSIGRFPVNTTAQAQTMVDKTVGYERDCDCGTWNQNAVFATDDLEDGGGNFYTFSDAVADGYADPPANTIKFLPEYFSVQKEYLGQTCSVSGNPTSAVQCRQEITSTLNLNGALFLSYIGHSTKEYWAAEHVYDKASVDTLSNGPCLPIVLAMTCYEGSFHDPDTEVLAEANVRKPGGGAIASFSPTGFGLATGHDYLEKGLLTAWFQKGLYRLGPSVDYAKRYLDEHAAPGEHRDLIDTFALLGDPALKVKTTEACLVPTAVELAAFSTQQDRSSVRVTWDSVDESEIMGFNVLRRQAGATEYAAINPELIVAAHPGSAKGASYLFHDAHPAIGTTYQYVLEIFRLDGARERFGFAEARLNSVSLFVPFMRRP